MNRSEGDEECRVGNRKVDALLEQKRDVRAGYRVGGRRSGSLDKPYSQTRKNRDG